MLERGKKGLEKLTESRTNGGKRFSASGERKSDLPLLRIALLGGCSKVPKSFAALSYPDTLLSFWSPLFCLLVIYLFARDHWPHSSHSNQRRDNTQQTKVTVRNSARTIQKVKHNGQIASSGGELQPKLQVATKTGKAIGQKPSISRKKPKKEGRQACRERSKERSASDE